MQEPTDTDEEADDTTQPNYHTFPYDAINLPLDDEYYSEIFDPYPDCDEEQVIDNPNNLQLEISTAEDQSYCTRSCNVVSVPISQPLPLLHYEGIEISQSSMQTSILENTYELENSRIEWHGHASLNQYQLLERILGSNNWEELQLNPSGIENSTQEIAREEICDLKNQEKAYALCHICAEIFEDDDDLSIHLIEEHQEEMITFSKNNFTSNHWKELQVGPSSLESSSQEISPDKKVGILQYQEKTCVLCHVCGEIFGDNVGFYFHLIQDHRQELVIGPNNIFTSNNLEEMQAPQSNMGNSADEIDDEDIFNFKYLEKTRALCPVCGEQFEDEDGLSIHLDWHDCAIYFQDQQEQLITNPNQQDIIHEDALCHKCGEQFVDEDDLFIHMDSHDSDQSRDPLIPIKKQALGKERSYNFSKRSKNLIRTAPSKMAGFRGKSGMATRASGILVPAISKGASCPKCHAKLSSESNVKTHLANNSCKKKCDKCSCKISRHFWKKHVIFCTKNDNKFHNEDHKSQDNVEGKSASFKIPSPIPKSATASGSSDSRPCCPKCNVILSSKNSVRRHLATNSCRKKCDTCGGHIIIRLWANHLLRCKEIKSKKDILRHENHKSRKNVEEKSEPCKIPGFAVKSAMASESSRPSGKLPSVVSKRSSCPKCNKTLSSKNAVRRHLATNSCKKKCNTCGRKMLPLSWANHVSRCSQQYQSVIKAPRSKSRANAVVKSEPSKIPGVISKSAMASGSSESPGKLAPSTSKSFDCPTCHANFNKKKYLKKHIARKCCKIKCDICGGKFDQFFWPVHVIRCTQNLSKNNKILPHGNQKSRDVVVQNKPKEEKSPNLEQNRTLTENIWAPKKSVRTLKTANANEFKGKENDSIILDEKIIKPEGSLRSVPASQKITAAKKKLALTNVSPSNIEDVFQKIFCGDCKNFLSKTNYLCHLPCSKSQSDDTTVDEPPATLQQLAEDYDLVVSCGTCDVHFPNLESLEIHNPKRCYNILHCNKNKLLYNLQVGLQRLTEKEIKMYQNRPKDDGTM